MIDLHRRDGRLLRIGHRGAAALAPENTIACARGCGRARLRPGRVRRARAGRRARGRAFARRGAGRARHARRGAGLPRRDARRRACRPEDARRGGGAGRAAPRPRAGRAHARQLVRPGRPARARVARTRAAARPHLPAGPPGRQPAAGALTARWRRARVDARGAPGADRPDACRRARVGRGAAPVGRQPGGRRALPRARRAGPRLDGARRRTGASVGRAGRRRRRRRRSQNRPWLVLVQQYMPASGPRSRGHPPIALSKATQPCCGRVAWCSRPETRRILGRVT